MNTLPVELKTIIGMAIIAVVMVIIFGLILLVDTFPVMKDIISTLLVVALWMVAGYWLGMLLR